MKERIYAIVFMMVSSIIAIGALSFTGIYTKDVREQNQFLAQYRALLIASGVANIDTPSNSIFEIYPKCVEERVHGTVRVFHVQNAKGEKVALVLPVNGQGFWGPINGYLALSTDGEIVKGLIFYKHQETPGLGQRIEEKWFTDQFLNRDITKNIKGKVFVFSEIAPAPDSQPIKGITGATRTSDSVESLLNKGVSNFLEAFAKDPVGKKVEPEKANNKK